MIYQTSHRIVDFGFLAAANLTILLTAAKSFARPKRASRVEYHLGLLAVTLVRFFAQPAVMLYTHMNKGLYEMT